MGHAPFPPGATGPEIQVIQKLHRAACRHPEPEVRSALSEAVDLIVELIEDRISRRGFDARYDSATDGD